MTAGKLAVQKIVFVGAGNMAEALVRGLTLSGACAPRQIVMTDVRADRLEALARQYGVETCASNAEAVRGSDMIVLAVKPQVMDEALQQVKAALKPSVLVLSIAAGIRTTRIENALGEGRRVVRAMPNTPALVRSGAAAICGGRWADERDLQLAEAVMGAVGVVARVREEDMDAITALSGSGPAYVFYLIEAMLEAARKLKLDEAVAKTMVYATIEGAAKLIRESGAEAADLRQRVTSKGGTTAAALEVLGGRGVGGAVAEAVLAAHKRSRELSGS